MDKIRKIVVVLLSLVAVGTLFMGVKEIWQEKKDQDAFEALQKQIEQAKKESISEDNSEIHQEQKPLQEMAVESEPQILPSYRDLHKQNNDMVGWIKIEGTALNYPVMFTPSDPMYYLRRGFDKASSYAGTPFVGEDNEMEPLSDNLIIYGHNMKNGTMFHTLTQYKNKDFYQKHPTLQFDTLYEKGIYDILAVFPVDVTAGEEHFEFYQTLNFEDHQAFDNYINQCKALAYYDTGVEASFGDQLVTLCTCSYESSNGRTVMVGVKRK